MEFSEGNQNAFECTMYAGERRRWFALAGFFLVAFTQCAQWNFYAPIAAVIEPAYGWSDSDLSLLLNAANLTFTCGVVPWMVLVQVCGLRTMIVVCQLLLFCCAALRSLQGTGSGSWSAAFSAMSLNGLSAAPLNFAGVVLSEVWFPANERATATAVTIAAMDLGTSFAFLLGPFLVPEGSMQNGTASADLNSLYVGHLVWAGALMLAVFFMYPPRPLHPPSPAAAHRLTCKSQPSIFAICHDLWRALTNMQFLLLLVCIVPPISTWVVWLAMLGVILQDIGIPEIEAGWIGFWSTITGCVVSIVAARIVDQLAKRKLRTVIVLLFLLAFAAFSAFGFLVGDASRTTSGHQQWPLILLSIIGSASCSAASPFFFELGVEMTYPLPETVSAGWIVLVEGTIQAILLAMPFDKWGTRWLLYALPGVLLPCSVLLSCTPVVAIRQQAETGNDVSSGLMSTQYI